MIECQTGQTAEEQRGCVEDVRDEIEDFGLSDGGHRKDILDILHVAATAEIDQDDGEDDECDID